MNYTRDRSTNRALSYSAALRATYNTGAAFLFNTRRSVTVHDFVGDARNASRTASSTRSKYHP